MKIPIIVHPGGFEIENDPFYWRNIREYHFGIKSIDTFDIKKIDKLGKWNEDIVSGYSYLK